MGDSAAAKRKNAYKPILDPVDKNSLFTMAVAAAVTIEVCSEQTIDYKTTVFKAQKWTETHLHAEYVAGPPIAQGPVTAIFEMGKIWYCSTGHIFLTDKTPTSSCALDIDQVFELQRRESYRVVIPVESIVAKFDVGTFRPSKSFNILDISEGGMALEIEKGDANLFPLLSVIRGTLHIAQNDPLEDLAAEILHIIPLQEKLKVGCRFVQTTVSLRQRIAFLVNACHRAIFSTVGRSTKS